MFLDSIVDLKMTMDRQLQNASFVFQDEKRMCLSTNHDSVSYYFYEDSVQFQSNTMTKTIYTGTYGYNITTDEETNLVSKVDFSFSNATNTYGFELNKSYFPFDRLKHKTINFEY